MIHAADVDTKSTIAERGDIETARPGGKGTDDAQDGETVLTGLIHFDNRGNQTVNHVQGLCHTPKD